MGPSSELQSTSSLPDPSPGGADMALEVMSPEAQLARKVKWGKVFALLETVFYAVLIPLMVRHFFFHDNSTANALARRIIAYFHGFVVMGFCYMVFDLRRLLRWSWPFFVFALLPIGSLVAHARLGRWQREGLNSAPGTPDHCVEAMVERGY